MAHQVPPPKGPPPGWQRRVQFAELAQGYALRNGVPPNHLVLGREIAERYKDVVNDMMGITKPIPSHPAHTRLVARSGIWFPERPAPLTPIWKQWKRVWDCKHKRGGHWWHPADAMIAWFCCGCGAERDGMPEDGT